MTIYSAAFLFEPGAYDADFHRLNALIEATARAARVARCRIVAGQRRIAAQRDLTLGQPENRH